MSNDGVWVKVWPESDGGTGITGWADITGITGTSGKRYTYDNWVAYEFLDDGSAATSGGLVDALIVGGGSWNASISRTAGRVISGMQLLPSGQSDVEIAQGGQQTIPPTASTLGPITMGAVDWSGAASRVFGAGYLEQGVVSKITNVEKEYASASGTTPGSCSSSNGANGQPGVVIVRVPSEFNKVTTLPAGWSEA